VARCGRTAGPPELPALSILMESFIAELAPPATMKTPVRAALRGRPVPASEEALFSTATPPTLWENNKDASKGAVVPPVRSYRRAARASGLSLFVEAASPTLETPDSHPTPDSRLTTLDS